MQSGIVYFEEIVENIKDITGITNLRPYYDRIRRFVFNAERDIAAGGMIVRKKKEYTIGDGFYDGYNIILPEDFIGEHSCNDLHGAELKGNVLTLSCKGSNEIDVRYLGYLLDENGNPYTTRNHLEAVVLYSRHRLYSSRVFLGSGGSHGLYREFKQEYFDEVLAARGNDAFPTEEEWAEIGKTMNGGYFEAITNCGMMCFGPECEDNTATDNGSINPSDPNDTGEILSCNIVSIFNSSLIDTYVYTPLPTNTPSTTGSTSVTGTLSSSTQVLYGSTTLVAFLGARVSISGSIFGSSSIS